MRLQRGDSTEKRYAWLEEHFATRHAGRALPYPCLIDGCSLRFSFKRSLEDHLRGGHDRQHANNCRTYKRQHTSLSDRANATFNGVDECKRAKRRVDSYFVPPIGKNLFRHNMIFV